MKKTFLLFIVCVFAFVGCTSKTISSEVLSWQEQYDLGVRYLNEGNYEEAIIAFTAAIEIDEKNTAAYLGRAEAYIGRGENEENLSLALKDYEKVIELDENVSAAYLGMADVYIRRGEYDKALEILKNAPDSAKNDEIAAKIAELESGNVEDSDGKTRKSCHYENGDLIKYWLYEYDEKGNNIITNNYNADDSLLSTAVSEFDDTGLELKQTETNATDGYTRVETYEYNSQRRKIKATIESIDVTGSVSGKYTLFTYDSTTNSVIQDTYFNDGTFFNRFVVEKDENDRRFKGSNYYLNDAGELYLDYYVEYIWNSDGSYGGYDLYQVAEKDDN